MHPAISSIVSNVFYDSKLIDGNVERNDLKFAYGPLTFIEVEDSYESLKDTSFLNTQEAYAIRKFLEHLLAETSSVDLKSNIGITSPYKAQMFSVSFVRPID